MPSISHFTLPSGNTYEVKDAAARDAIASLSGGAYFLGVTTTVLADQSTTNPITVNGESVTAINGNIVIYSSSEFVWSCTGYSYYSKTSTSDVPPKYYYTAIANPSAAQKDAAVFVNETVPTTSGSAVTEPLGNGADIIKHEASGKWVQFGDLSTLGALAYKDNVTLSKGSGDQVLGESTSFTNGTSEVTFASGAGSDFVTGYNNDAVAPSFTEGAFNAGSLPSLGASSKSQFAVEGIVAAMGTGNDAETLIFSAASKSNAVTEQGTFSAGSLPSKAADTFNAGSAATLAKAKALTAANTGTAAAQTITVGTNDKVKVAKYDDLGVSVS